MNTFFEYLPSLVLVIFLLPMIASFFMGQFGFEFYDDYLLVRRWIFGFCPFGRKKIYYGDIADIHLFEIKKDLWRGAEIFGRLLFRPGVILVKRHGVFRRIYFTPDKPQEFIENIRLKIAHAG